MTGTTPEKAAELGLRPLVRLVSWAVAGVPPATMGIGPVPASAKVLDATGLTLADIDLIELNEAFAAQALAVTREWKLAPADLDRLNVNGSGISLGHPVGATGARILATLAREMQAPTGALRPGDHVHRWRPRARRRVRAGVIGHGRRHRETTARAAAPVLRQLDGGSSVPRAAPRSLRRPSTTRRVRCTPR